MGRLIDSLGEGFFAEHGSPLTTAPALTLDRVADVVDLDPDTPVAYLHTGLEARPGQSLYLTWHSADCAWETLCAIEERRDAGESLAMMGLPQQVGQGIVEVTTGDKVPTGARRISPDPHREPVFEITDRAYGYRVEAPGVATAVSAAITVTAAGLLYLDDWQTLPTSGLTQHCEHGGCETCSPRVMPAESDGFALVYWPGHWPGPEVAAAVYAGLKPSVGTCRGLYFMGDQVPGGGVVALLAATAVPDGALYLAGGASGVVAAGTVSGWVEADEVYGVGRDGFDRKRASLLANGGVLLGEPHLLD